MQNSIFIIRPYNYHGSWVFDDDRVGLVREPFVSGMPAIIERYVQKLPDPENGFTAIFSAGEMPEYDLVLEKSRAEAGGTWYTVDGMEGWLCPALLKYFDTPPDKIYIRINE